MKQIQRKSRKLARGAKDLIIRESDIATDYIPKAELEASRNKWKTPRKDRDKPARTDPPDKAPQQFKPNVYDNR
eukprot:Nk52_evm1s1531 gene=Nk52_evmTU1s1531